MRQYARIESNVVVEIISLDDSVDIETAFHSDLEFIEVTGVPGVEVGWIVSGSSVQPPPPPPPPTTVELKGYSVNARWTKEQSGTTLSSGMPIETNDRAQAKINGTRQVAEQNASLVTEWHAADGNFYTLASSDIINMSDELQIHINNCFSISADVDSQIDAGTITTYDQIDAAYNAPMSEKNRNWLKAKAKK